MAEALAADPEANVAVEGRIADIRDFAAVKAAFDDFKPEIVIHMAAQPLVRRSYQDPLGTWATNVNGSLHVLEALKPLQHPCAVVMVTTDKVSPLFT